MLGISSPIPERRVSFSPEVSVQTEKKALREAKREVNKLLLQSDVAFVVDLSFSLKLLEKAKSIIDQRFPDDEALLLRYSMKVRILKKDLDK